MGDTTERHARRVTIQFPPSASLRWRLAYAWSVLMMRDHDLSGVTFQIEYDDVPAGTPNGEGR